MHQRATAGRGSAASRLALGCAALFIREYTGRGTACVNAACSASAPALIRADVDPRWRARRADSGDDSGIPASFARLPGQKFEKDGINMSEEAEATYKVTANELRQFVERIERLEQEKKDLAEQIKEVYAESRGRGYDVKALRSIISLRKRDKDDIAEQEAVIEMYKEALGM